ncbi:hypothetical protein GCM10018782_43510 [Streptomyces griseoaurantiacus]|nr:hypothetical protein GCM10018782_43510 [Streptomyces griseoaurantiacus]
MVSPRGGVLPPVPLALGEMADNDVVRRRSGRDAPPVVWESQGDNAVGLTIGHEQGAPPIDSLPLACPGGTCGKRHLTPGVGARGAHGVMDYANLPMPRARRRVAVARRTGLPRVSHRSPTVAHESRTAAGQPVDPPGRPVRIADPVYA